MKTIKCKHFYVPSFNSKGLISTGYCQKITDKCGLLTKKIKCKLLEPRR